MSDEEERKRRRERNNESVRKCRENEKKRVDKARADLAQHKQDNKELEEKYSSLRRELELLKSLFNSPSSATNTAATSTTTSTNTPSTSAAAIADAKDETTSSTSTQHDYSLRTNRTPRKS